MNKTPLKKVYVGCALTTLPNERREEFLKMIDDLKSELRKNYEVLEFIGIADPLKETPLQVYRYDVHECVLKADYMIAICDYPALGLGYEIATAVEKQGIPVVAVAHKNISITRLIRGIDHPKFAFYQYETLGDIVEQSTAHFNQF
jgi:hypothetical protein